MRVSTRGFAIGAIVLMLANTSAFGQWQQQSINTDADFRGLGVVSSDVAWVSGTKGTYGRTSDGGKTWIVGNDPDAEKLDFRGLKAFDKNTAYLMSAGPGDESRIYKTTDGGRTWSLRFKNLEPKAFFDAISMPNEEGGAALSDPV